MKSNERKEHILQAAVTAAKAVGYDNLRREDVAKQAQCSEGLVNQYWGTMSQLKRAVMRRAVKEGHVGIVAVGLAQRDKLALRAAPEIKSAAAQLLVG